MSSSESSSSEEETEEEKAFQASLQSRIKNSDKSGDHEISDIQDSRTPSPIKFPAKEKPKAAKTSTDKNRSSRTRPRKSTSTSKRFQPKARKQSPSPAAKSPGKFSFKKLDDLPSDISSSDDSEDSDDEGEVFVDDVDLLLKSLKLADEKRKIEEETEKARLARIRSENEKLERELQRGGGGNIDLTTVKDLGNHDIALLERIEAEVQIGINKIEDEDTATGFFGIFNGFFGLCAGSRDDDDDG